MVNLHFVRQAALALGRVMAERLPEELVLRAGDVAGRTVVLSASARGVVANNLRHVNAEVGRLEQASSPGLARSRSRYRLRKTRAGAADVYASYGRYWAEMLLPSRPGGAMDLDRIDVQGLEHLEAAEHRGPVCAITGHLGNWDLAARWFARRLPDFAVLAEELANRRLFEAFLRMRERHGMRVIHGENSGTALYKHLRRGGHAGLVADRAFGSGVEAVPFLGGLRLFPSSGLRIALRAEASLLPVFLVRAGGRFCLRIHPAIEPGCNPVRAYARMLEREVMAFPDQWCVLYPLHDAVEGR